MSLIQTSDFLTLLPIGIPCAGGLLILLVQISLPKFRSFLSYWLSVLCLIITILLISLSLTLTEKFSPALSSLSWLPGSELNMQASNLAFGGQIVWSRYEAIYSLAIACFALIILVMGRTSLIKQKLNLVEAYEMILFSVTGLILFICSNNLIIMFLSLELSSLPIFVLAGWNRKIKSCNEAAIKYFLISAFSVAFFLLGTAFIYGAYGSVDLNTISNIPRLIALFNDQSYSKAGFILLLMSLCFKAALFPLHAWVADVYEGSITVVTAFMAALIKIASVGVIFKLLRIFSPFIITETDITMSPIYLILSLLAAFSMFYGNITAITQKNLKRLFAYSSIAHAGYMASLFPLAFSTTYADKASEILIFYVLSYAITSTLAFGVISFLETSEKSPRIIHLDTIKGLADRYPYLAFLLCLSAFSLAGIPPLIGFYGKFYLLKALLDTKMYVMAILLSLNSLIAVFYYARIFFHSYWFGADVQKEKRKTLLSGFSHWVSISLLGTATVILGILSGYFIE